MDKKVDFFDAEEEHISLGINHLLVIGIDNYKNGIRPLSNCVKDAKEFVSTLSKKYYFDNDDNPKGNTRVLYNENASLENIIDAFRFYATLKEEYNYNLLIYFSGHGYYENGIGYLVPSDAYNGRVATLLNNGAIKEYIEACKAKHILFIVDSCYSGSFLQNDKESFSAGTFLSASLKQVYAQKSRWVIAAGGLETVSDGGYNSNSPFAKHLLAYLNNHTGNGFSASHLAEYIQDKMETEPYISQKPIAGYLALDKRKTGKFVFIPKKRYGDIDNFLCCKSKKDYIKFIEKYPYSPLVEKAKTMCEFIDFMEIKSQAPFIVTQTFIDDIVDKDLFLGNKEMQEKEYNIVGRMIKIPYQNFEIAKYPITQKQWELVMGNNPSHFHGKNLPVENISWNEIQTFIKTLNEKTGEEYRLPTQNEWVIAAKASTKHKYAGSNDVNEVAWFWRNSGNKKNIIGDWDKDLITKRYDCKTHIVGAKKPNDYGLYDMSGNVWEVCSDTYIEDNSMEVIIKGGSWYNQEIDCLCEYSRKRHLYHFDERLGNNIGLRLVK